MWPTFHAEVSGPLPADTASSLSSSDVSVLQKDAFLVFRALCKLSMQTKEGNGAPDAAARRGKVRQELALLDNIVFQSRGGVILAAVHIRDSCVRGAKCEGDD